jgi:uncharacterized protein (TIGR00251 family)
MELNSQILQFKKQLADTGELYLTVRARPGAAKTQIKSLMDDESFKIDIAAPPEKGKANEELIKFLAKEFNLNKSEVVILSGKADKLKLLKLKNNDGK